MSFRLALATEEGSFKKINNKSKIQQQLFLNFGVGSKSIKNAQAIEVAPPFPTKYVPVGLREREGGRVSHTPQPKQLTTGS